MLRPKGASASEASEDVGRMVHSFAVMGHRAGAGGRGLARPKTDRWSAPGSVSALPEFLCFEAVPHPERSVPVGHVFEGVEDGFFEVGTAGSGSEEDTEFGARVPHIGAKLERRVLLGVTEFDFDDDKASVRCFEDDIGSGLFRAESIFDFRSSWGEVP